MKIHSLFGGLLLLCLTSFHPPQLDILQKKISATYQNATLAEVLVDLKEQYDLRFAYLNNELPTHQKLTLNFQNAPLYEVLDVLLEDTALSYQVMNGQIVLTKKPKQAKRQSSEQEENTPVPPATKPSSSTGSPSAPSSEATASTSMTVLSEERPEEPQDLNEDSTAHIAEEEADQIVSSKPNTEVPEQVLTQTEDSVAIKEQKPAVTPKIQNETPPVHRRKPELTEDEPSISRKISEAINEGLDFALFDHLPDESPYKESPIHIGVIYPISSNGVQAGQYVNQLSFHLLVGYAAGLDGLEASALGNIENDFVDGAQFAGFFNVVKNRVEGVQAAGFMNLSGGTLEGGQFAGFLNTHAGEVEGIQAAGFLNLATGHTQGAQFSGFGSIITDHAKAVQGSGFTNIATGNLTGAQFAGFGNYAYQVKGAQFAGFANITTGHVQGFQGSGFINVARTVKGVQLGVFNVADSVDGVPIGFLSIVRKNGYRALEVWGGETLHANIAYKIGVRKFYNIFSFGSQFGDTDFRYGLGYGIGTVAALAPTIDFSVDLLAQHIYEESNPIFDNNTRLNLLNTLRLGFSKQFSQHFGLFAAPTFNVFVSEVEGKDGTIGSDLSAPYTFFDRTYQGKTNLQMWAGFQVGLRF